MSYSMHQQTLTIKPRRLFVYDTVLIYTLVKWPPLRTLLFTPPRPPPSSLVPWRASRVGHSSPLSFLPTHPSQIWWHEKTFRLLPRKSISTSNLLESIGSLLRQTHRHDTGQWPILGDPSYRSHVYTSSTEASIPATSYCRQEVLHPPDSTYTGRVDPIWIRQDLNLSCLSRRIRYST